MTIDIEQASEWFDLSFLFSAPRAFGRLTRRWAVIATEKEMARWKNGGDRGWCGSQFRSRQLNILCFLFPKFKSNPASGNKLTLTSTISPRDYPFNEF
jgi:hypothetical protein